MKGLSLLSLGALALAAPTKEARSNKVEYARARHAHQTRADGTVDLDWYFGTLKYTILKYNKNYVLPEVLQKASLIVKRDTDAEEALTDQTEGTEDELYYGPVYIGSANQKFQIDFDTGSSDLFVPGPSCTSADGCPHTTKYDQGGVDEHNTTTITYGSGEVTGENYFDTVTVAGLTAKHQNVISATELTGFADSDADGLLGMAFQSIAESGQPPFFFTLINEGAVSPTEFSFYLGREESGTAQNSELTLGGRDSSKYTGGFTEVPLTAQTYWQVGIDGATVGSSLLPLGALPTTAGNAAIDTGTTLIIAPTIAALSIYAQIPGSIPLPLVEGVGITAFAYPCASNPDVSLVFAGKDFAINNLDFNFGTLNSDFGLMLGNDTLVGELANGYCLGGIAGGDIDPTEELWVVGDTFIKNWYSTFHYDSPSSAYVAFAKSV